VNAAAPALVAAALVLLDRPPAVGARLELLAGRGRLRRRDESRRVRWRTRPRLRAPRIALSPRTRVSAWLVGIAVAGLSGGPLVAAVAVACAAVHVMIGDVLAARRAARSRAQATEAIRLLAAELGAGTGLPVALSAAAQVAPQHAACFQGAATAAHRAADVATPLTSSGEPALVAAGHALRLAAGCGAPVGAVLARVLADTATRDEARRMAATALAGPRASCTLLTALPAVGVAMGVAMGARPGAFLLGPPAGRLDACAGVVLDVLGLLWVRWIIRRAVPP
jgi:tight adherence protein B